MAEEKNGTLEFVNMLRSRTTLNGKPLEPLTQEDLTRQAERIAKDKERRERILAEKRKKLYPMIDHVAHAITEQKPKAEFSQSDYMSDYDFSFTENRSYYVAVRTEGHRDTYMIARHFESWTNSRGTIKWQLPDGRFTDVDDTDTWEYTEEAFEQGLSELNI